MEAKFQIYHLASDSSINPHHSSSPSKAVVSIISPESHLLQVSTFVSNLLDKQRKVHSPAKKSCKLFAYDHGALTVQLGVLV